MLPNYQLLYQKSISLRACEAISILLGDKLSIERTHIRIDLDSEPSKTFIFVACLPDVTDQTFIRHLRAEKKRSEIDFKVSEDDIAEFTELQVSAAEDARFQISIYLKG